METVTRRRRRGALGLAVAATLGLAPQVADPGAWPGLLPVTRRAVGARSLPQGLPERLATDVDGAFLLLAENALWLTRQGARARLASGAGGWLQDPAWSPDGTQVSYTHFRFDVPRPSGSSAGGAPGGVPWPTGEVYALRPDAPGTAPRPLVRREAPHEALVSASWAPDGGALYAVRRRLLGPTTVRGDLVRCDLQTGAVAELSVPFEATEVSAGPGSAPGGELAVVGVTGPAVTGLPDLALVLLGADGALRQVATTAVERGAGAGATGLGFLSLPRFSPDGRRLAFAAGDGTRPARRPARRQAHRPALPVGAGSGGGGFLRAAGLRPVAAHGLRGWPWVADLETGALRQIATGGHDDLAGIAWLPDGERLLILDVSGLAVVDLASGSLARIPEATAGLAATALAYAPRLP